MFEKAYSFLDDIRSQEKEVDNYRNTFDDASQKIIFIEMGDFHVYLIW